MKAIKLTLIFLIAASTAFAQNYQIDQKLGDEYTKVVEKEMGLYQNDSLLNLVNSIGAKLVSQLNDTTLKFRFFLVDARDPNAFAVPGGYVYVTRGLFPLLETEDELAGIMAHEIVHVVNRHSVKQMKSSILPTLLKIPGNLINGLTGTNIGNIVNSPIDLVSGSYIATYSREHEYEADWYGALLAARAGYKTDALADALNRLSKTIEVITGETEQRDYLSDHPMTAKRVQKIRKLAEKNPPVPSAPITNGSNDFVSRLENLIVGPNPQQGLFIDTLFVHPDMNFSFITPSGWNNMNKPTVVASIEKEGAAMASLEMVDPKKAPKEYGDEIVGKLKGNEAVTVLAATDTSINNLSAYLLRLKAVDKNQIQFMEIVWVRYQSNIYQLTGAALPSHLKPMHQMLASFKPATPAELEMVKIYELHVVEPNTNETLPDLSKRVENRYNNALIAVINDISSEKAIPEGKLVKVVKSRAYKSGK